MDTLIVSGKPTSYGAVFGRSLQMAMLAGLAMLGLAALFKLVIGPFVASIGVVETFTTNIGDALIGLLPVGVYVGAGLATRNLRRHNVLVALIIACAVALLGYGVLIGYQYATQSGPFRQAPTIGFTLQQTEAGAEITSLVPGGAAEVAGLQVGDVIQALRRDPVTADELNTLITQASADDAFRFRFLRAGEEQQLTTRIQLASQVDTGYLLRGAGAALFLAIAAVLFPSRWILHLLLILSLIPLLTGYLWLILSTFSPNTHGLMPVDSAGNLSGLTLENWNFLSGADIGGPATNIWTVTLNSLIIAVVMTIASLFVCSITGYALSRMKFPGRRGFLAMTLILHGFPAVTLLIPIFLVLMNLGNIPVIGKYIGYNSAGGVALVMIAFELPLGTWLIKGFFDTVSWDMERSALIDGASRWRVFWEIILPQIRPGLLALGIFSFIGGWNAYLIPATYSVGTGLANLPVYIRQLSGELAPVNWGQVSAVGLFQLVPIFIFFIFAQEYLLNIYAGGTKGSS